MDTIKIEKINQINYQIWDQKYETGIKRHRSPYLYRGLSNSAFNLATSLQRNCQEKKDIMEPVILRNFTKYATIEDPKLGESVWRQMIVGQHHGLPTRLLDWQYSVLLALHFATSGQPLDTMGDHDCAMWRIDIEELNQKLPDRYQKILKNENAHLLTVDMMDKLIPENTDVPIDHEITAADTHDVPFEPETPDVPSEPETNAPETPNVPGEPETDVPETPDVPDVPSRPATAATE